jgi:predicted TPR repeat methyltransferase
MPCLTHCIGDLAPVFEAAAASSSSDAVFGFSVEALEGGGASAGAGSAGTEVGGAVEVMGGFKLRATGRYAHTRAYIEELAPKTGWSLRSMQKDVIRMNAGEPIHGLLVVLVRSTVAE